MLPCDVVSLKQTASQGGLGLERRLTILLMVPHVFVWVLVAQVMRLRPKSATLAVNPRVPSAAAASRGVREQRAGRSAVWAAVSIHGHALSLTS